MKTKQVKIEEIEEYMAAMNFYFRIFCGQFEKVFILQNKDWSFYKNKNDKALKLLSEIRKICIPKLFDDDTFSSVLGILGPDTPLKAKKVFDILQIFHYQLANYDSTYTDEYLRLLPPIIQGNWHIHKDTLEFLNKVIEKFQYEDYKGISGWNCPIIISEFYPETNEVSLSRNEKNIDRILNETLKVLNLVKMKQLKKAFLILFPKIKNDKKAMEILTELEYEYQSNIL